MRSHRKSSARSILLAAGLAVLAGNVDEARAQVPACVAPKVDWQGSRAVFRSSRVESGPDPFRSATVSERVILSVGRRTGPDADSSDALVELRPSSRGPLSRSATIPPPQGSTMFRYPVLAGSPNDGLVAVWGERTDSVHRAPGTDPSDIARIVAADYRGGVWSKPTVLVQASGIGWNSISISNAVATKRGTIHVAVPAYRHLQTEFLLVLSYSAGRWRTREIPKRAGAVYATLAVRNDSLLMAFASPATDGVADISSIWFASSADDGLTWGTPRLLRRSGLVPAYDVKIVSGPSGPITIVWRQIDREELAEYFWAIRSHDGGRTWTAPTKWAAPNAVARVYSAIASEKGDADLMYASYGGAQLNLVRACADGSWRHAPASPDSLKPANGAAFIEESDGSRGIVWSVIVPIWPPFRQWLYTAVR